MQSTALRSEAFDGERCLAKTRNVWKQRSHQSRAYEPRCCPGRKHAQRHRHAGAKYHGSHWCVALRKQLQVRHVTVGKAACADRLWIRATSEILPAVGDSPGAVAPLLERL